MKLVALIVLAACGRDHFDPPHNIAFVTSALLDPLSFGSDLSGADAACAAAANEADLHGNFVALVGTGEIPAYARLGSARGWVRVDGSPLADRVQDLMNGPMVHPLWLDEHGEMTAGNVAVGKQTSDNHPTTCDDWVLNTGKYFVNTTDFAVIAFPVSSVPCTNTTHLYCLGIDFSTELGFAPAAGRHMFVTVQGFLPTGGIAQADALCAQEASLAGLGGTYLAALDTSTASAASRFDLTGPNWVRMDGLPIAASPLDLIAGQLTASPNMTARGEVANVCPLTGGQLGVTSARTCVDWTNPLSNNILGGQSAYASATAFVDDPQVSCGNCSGVDPIYCLEQ